MQEAFEIYADMRVATNSRAHPESFSNDEKFDKTLALTDEVKEVEAGGGQQVEGYSCRR